MLYRLLVFIAFYGLLTESAENLDKFCHSRFLTKLSETTPEYFKYNTTCAVTLPFGDVGPVQAGEICTYYSPFRTISAKSEEESTKCVYKSNIACPSSKDHIIAGKCIRMVYEKTTHAGAAAKCQALQGDLSSSTYKLLKVTDEHMARWVTVFDDVLTRSKGIWIDHASKTDLKTGSGNKYLNLELDLSKGKEISSILYGSPDKEYLVACEATKTETFADQVDPLAPKKYFLSNNLYQPSDFLKDGSDGLKEMDAVCKKINPNSMLAPGKPVDFETKDPVYVAVRGKSTVARDRFNPSTTCGINTETHLNHHMHFDAIIHTVEGSTTTSGVNKNDWATNYPMKDCADVARTAAVYSEKNKGLMDIPPIGRYRVACVTGKQEGLKVANPCGKGVLEPDGTCKCNIGAVDITDMTELPEAINYKKGELCVTANPCEDQKHVIMFILDGSDATHTDESFEGLKGFVLNAETLLDKINPVHFVAYGGRITKQSQLNVSWTSAQFKQAVNDVLPTYVGGSTNIADGFHKAIEIFEGMSRKPDQKRIIVHIGDGIPTGVTAGREPYYKLEALVDKFVSVSIVGFSGNMGIWHTPGDRVDFSSKTNYANLNLDCMNTLMRQVCKQQDFTKLIEDVQ